MPSDSWHTVADFLEQSAQRLPDKTALRYGNKCYSYAELYRQATNVAAFLQDHTPHDAVVGLLLPNTPELIQSYFGTLMAGRRVLLLPTNISDNALEYQISITKTALIFGTPVTQKKFARCTSSAHTEFLTQAPHSSSDFLPMTIDPDRTASIIFTSGTSAHPKGVELRHRNIVAATRNIIQYTGWRESDIDINISQLSHSFGLGHIHCVFAVGATSIVFRDSIDLLKILETMKNEHATTFGAVPAILRILNDHYHSQLHENGLNLRCIQTNTSALEPELIKGILDALPSTDFYYYYGLTEASRSTFITLNREKDRMSSVGRASPNVKLEIRDENDHNLPSGSIGEVCIAGDHVVNGYWQDPEASQRIRNGWLHTGDAGYLDAQGYLFLIGRKDDIINVSGEKVSPEEIEAVVRPLEGIIDAAAVGAPDNLLGQVVQLFIVVNQQPFSLERVLTACRASLEPYKVPRMIKIVDRIPKTESGKIMRYKLRKKFLHANT